MTLGGHPGRSSKGAQDYKVPAADEHAAEPRMYVSNAEDETRAGLS